MNIPVGINSMIGVARATPSSPSNPSARAGIATDSSSNRGPIPRFDSSDRRAELIIFSLLLILLNLPLLFGRSTAAWSFRPDAVATGEWWRLLSHPFVHVSWYHLILDGAAFLILYANLLAGQRWQRLTYVAASAAGSLIVALVASPLTAAHGLCGLSGAAHGLMAISSVETLKLARVDRTTRTIAVGSLLAITAKCLFELATGQTPFALMHFGPLGTPIVACHAGGMLGGLVAALLISMGKDRR